MTQSNNSEFWFGPLFRLAGYALLALSLLDIINIFVLPGFTNPAWEFQMASNLVERSPVPLIGLVLVLVGEKNFRIFQFLSKACLVVGILFLLLLPLVISSAWRIQQQNTDQIFQQKTQIEEFKKQLTGATTGGDLSNVLTRFNPQASTPEIKNPQLVKKQLLERITAAEKQVKAQEATGANRTLNLSKNTVKSALGALIAGAWFLTIWRKTSQMVKLSKKQRVSLNSNLPLVNE